MLMIHPVVIAGVTYPARVAAKELARLTGRPFNTARRVLRSCDYDGDVALERLHRLSVSIKRRAVAETKAHQGRAIARVAKAKPVRQARQYDPESAAAMAKIARETGYSARRLYNVAKRDNLDMAQLAEWAQAQAPLRQPKRERVAAIAKIALETGFGTSRLYNVFKRDNLDLAQLAAWAQAHSRRVVVDGKTYPNKSAYFTALSRRYGISVEVVWYWKRAGAALEDLPAKALALSKTRDPDRFRRPVHQGEVAAYGWRWRSGTAFSFYYFGHSGGSSPARRAREQSKTELSWAKAALPRLLHLFDSKQMGPDCRWPPEREAELPKSCLPLNARDAREHDEDDMARWHGNIVASHARLRKLGEDARMNTEQRTQS